MLTQPSISERILDAIRKGTGQDLDSLMSDLPDLTWNQVFGEIDRLSRAGQIIVTCKSGGHYVLQMPVSDAITPEKSGIR